jgi:hypothetical protein
MEVIANSASAQRLDCCREAVNPRSTSRPVSVGFTCLFCRVQSIVSGSASRSQDHGPAFLAMSLITQRAAPGGADAIWRRDQIASQRPHIDGFGRTWGRETSCPIKQHYPPGSGVNSSMCASLCASRSPHRSRTGEPVRTTLRASPSASAEFAAVIARTVGGETFPRSRRQVADPDDRNEDVQRWALRFCRLVPFPDIQYPLSE